jgi:CheY-like chemotaxis protein
MAGSAALNAPVPARTARAPPWWRALRWPVHSLRSHFVAVILLTCLPIALVLGWRVAGEAVQTRARTDAELHSAAQALAHRVDRELRASADALATLADALPPGEHARRDRLLRAQQRMQPAWGSVFVADAGGSIQTDTDGHASPSDGADLAAGWANAAPQQHGATRVLRAASGQVLVAVPVDGGGQLLAVRLAPGLWQRLVDAEAPARGGFLGLVDGQGRMLAGTALGDAPPRWAPGGRGVQRLRLPDGHDALVAWQALGAADWRVAAGVPAAPLELAERDRVLQLLATTGASLLLGVTLALLLALRVTRSLDALVLAGAAPLDTPMAVREIAVLHAALLAARRADRQVADALLQRAEEFEALFRSSPIGLAFTRDADCGEVQCNPAMERLLGAGTPRAGSIEVLHGGARLEPGHQPLQQACHQGRPVSAMALELRAAGRAPAHVLASAVPLYGADGRPRGALSAVMDITGLKTAQDGLAQALRALQAKQALIELAQDAGEAGFLEFRFRVDELLCSAGMARLLGLAPVPLNGRLRDWLAAVAAPDLPAVRAGLAGAIAQRSANARLDFRAGDAAGASRWLSLRLHINYLDDGRPLQMVGVAVDATQHKKLEQRHRRATAHAQAAREDAEAASRAKDEFLLMLGHELRNPLGAIAGAAEVLHSGAGGPAMARRAVDIVLRQTQRLAQLLDDKLDRVEGAGARTPRPPPAPVPGGAPRRVVLVDDHADMRDAVEGLLALQGHTVCSAADGAAGLRLLLQEWPDAALVDIAMAGLDGLQLARQARAAGYAGRMVAMSGYGRPRAVQQARQAGFDAYLVKPVGGQALRAALDGHGEAFPP